MRHHFAPAESRETMRAVIREMAGWHEFYGQLDSVLAFLAPSQELQGMLLHNYFELEENWEQGELLFELKNQASESTLASTQSSPTST